MAPNLQAQWSFRTIVDDFTDEEYGVVWTRDTEDDEAMLSVDCENNDTPSIIFYFDQTMRGGENVRIRYRFDQQAPVGYDRWLNISGRAANAPPGTYTRHFLDAAISANALLIEAINDRADLRRRGRFSMTGLTAALDRLECM